MDYSIIVKTVRKDLGLSQEELAHILRVSFSTVNRWENGKTTPNKLAASVFFDFCEQRGIDVNAMINKGEGEK